jgi:hypothetical protein
VLTSLLLHQTNAQLAASSAASTKREQENRVLTANNAGLTHDNAALRETVRTLERRLEVAERPRQAAAQPHRQVRYAAMLLHCASIVLFIVVAIVIVADWLAQ